MAVVVFHMPQPIHDIIKYNSHIMNVVLLMIAVGVRIPHSCVSYSLVLLAKYHLEELLVRNLHWATRPNPKI